MTEDEAKTKWCPMYRDADPDFANRANIQGNFMGCCIASKCMAWRWRDKLMKPMPQDRGYCGLAGDQNAR